MNFVSADETVVSKASLPSRMSVAMQAPVIALDRLARWTGAPGSIPPTDDRCTIRPPRRTTTNACAALCLAAQVFSAAPNASGVSGNRICATAVATVIASRVAMTCRRWPPARCIVISIAPSKCACAGMVLRALSAPIRIYPMTNPAYDLIVIGSGPGGYVCAIRAAQLGMKVAVVEKDKTFGGTCLNVGCIPSKALLHASELYEEAGHAFAKMGIKVATPALDLPAMLRFKDEGVEGNVKGVAFLFRKNKIEAHNGVGRIVAPGKVEVKPARGPGSTLDAKAIVIATGSDVTRLKGIAIDEKRIVSSTGALSLEKVPT